MQVLIAEDERVTARQLEAMLVSWGYEAVVARDGNAAWKILQDSNPPKLAILDWMMPGMDGVEVCRKVRDLRQEPYTYLILLTERSRSQDLIDGMNAGADDYLTKPFDASELQVRLRAGQRVLSLIDEVIAAREKLRHDATHDTTTGLLNRRAIREVLDREMARATREARPLGLIIADLDHFKRVNDTFGHVAGDVVLAEVGRCLSAESHGNLWVGRYGGEEFLMVLTECDAETLLEKAEAFRHAIGERSLETAHGRITVTASMGAALYDGQQPMAVNELIHAADGALYAAKDAGRNRTLLVEPLCGTESR